MTDLSQLFIERVVNGLQAKAVHLPSQWAERYRVMGKPFPGQWSFDHHPWLREMHDCTDPVVAGQKAAQMGFTECALNRTFAAIDLKGDSVLYLLPTADNAADFSSGRFDPALDASAHLRGMFSNVKNVGHKRAGDASLYVRGTQSRSGVKSLPTAGIVYDELDEMNQANVTLAGERSAGQVDPWHYYISTPTILNHGINQKFNDSTQDHFFFKAPCCGHRVEWTLDDVILSTEDHTSKSIMDSYLRCPHCHKPIPHALKPEILASGEWVSKYPDKLIRGFHIPQMYSCADAGKAGNLALAILAARYDLAAEQELYNSKCGLVHTVKGARIDDEMFENARSNYTMYTSYRSHRPVTMGVDVGTDLHYSIDEWSLSSQVTGSDISAHARPRKIKVGTVKDFEDLDKLVRDYGVHYTVVDRHPERRKAEEFCQRFPNRASACIYAANRGSGKSIHVKENFISVDRTTWLDIMLQRYKVGGIDLPGDIPLEFKNHIQALTRIYQKDRDGNPVGRYVNTADDHYAHASTYSELALPLASEVAAGNHNIGGVI